MTSPGRTVPATTTRVFRPRSICVERALREHLTLIDGRPADDQLDLAAVRGRLPDVIETGFQLSGAEMLHAAIMSRQVPAGQ